MGQVPHGAPHHDWGDLSSEQHSQESLRELAKRYRIIRRRSPNGRSEALLQTFRRVLSRRPRRY
jgi:hypothetical protein